MIMLSSNFIDIRQTFIATLIWNFNDKKIVIVPLWNLKNQLRREKLEFQRR